MHTGSPETKQRNDSPPLFYKSVEPDHNSMSQILTLMDKIDDVNRALDARAYLAALSLTLTIPDILAQVEYPNLEGVGKRYVKWMNEFFVPCEHMPSKFNDKISLQMDKLNEKMDGDFYYQLRNSFLHSGNNDVSRAVKPLDFRLSLDEANVTSILEYPSGTYLRTYVLSIPDFCHKICALAVYTYKEYSSDPAKKVLLDDSNILIGF